MRHTAVFAALAATAIAAAALAQTWHTANQITVAWDPVEKIAPTDTIRYQLYLRPAGATVPIAAGGEVDAPRATATLQEEGRYFVCAQALRYPQGESTPIRSALACSDDPAAAKDGLPFGAVYFVVPAAPGGIRLAP